MDARMPRHIGLDFGTTNSSLAIADADGRVDVVAFSAGGTATTESFRSVAYFDPPQQRGLSAARSPAIAGPAAITRYLEAQPKGRLIQSIKSFAASRSFTSTSIFGKVYSFEHLVACVIKGLVSEAEQRHGPLGTAITVGRPVAFVGDDDAGGGAFAVGRLRAALEACGFREIRFEYEPIGAAYAYDRQLTTDALVLIADFGGGTSDFSLVRVGPTARATLTPEARILGSQGVPIAGDTFDACLIRHLVSPRLGSESSIRSSLGKTLPVPSWLYGHLERWHYLSFLKGEAGRIRDLIRQAEAPAPLQALLSIVEQDLGYDLHQAVQRTKVALSHETAATFELLEDDLAIVQTVSRADFEAWIAPHLARIERCIDSLLASAGTPAAAVDRVFLTGGSSFVPAVRAIFARRFGAERVVMGGEFTSVATGLALMAAERRSGA